MEKCLYQEQFISARYMLEKYKTFLKQTKETTKQKEIMADVYSYLKRIAPFMYSGLEMNALYRSLIKDTLDLEFLLNKEKLLDIKLNLNSSDFDGHVKLCFEGETEDKIKSIVQTIRELLFLRLNKSKGNDLQMLSANDLTGYCSICSSMVKESCKLLHLNAMNVHLEPGFISNSSLFSGVKKHYCTFVSSENDVYLVDISYSQFFWLKNNLIEKLGVPLLSGCSVGVFMIMTEERKKVAETLLRDGFIKVTPQVLKAYMDGFALSYRNGLAYEGTVSPSYTTDYTANDYLHFLYGEDNQLNHERDYTLGIQKRPLSRF